MTDNAITVAEIARRLSTPRHRVEYIIASRGITPATRAGITRIFHESDLPLIQSELTRIDRERDEVSL